MPFGFQLLSRVPEFLTHKGDPNMEIARPLIFLMALPLFVVSAVRFPNLQLRVHSSRAFVFHSATLIAAGIMLQGVAVAAWYVREYGGSNGTVLAVILLFGGAVAIAVALVSGSVRSRIRRFINENFFSLKYDYRVEWEKVIRALSQNPEQGSAERVLRTLCDLLDSPGGAIWIHRASWHQFLAGRQTWFYRRLCSNCRKRSAHRSLCKASTSAVSEPRRSHAKRSLARANLSLAGSSFHCAIDPNVVGAGASATSQVAQEA